MKPEYDELPHGPTYMLVYVTEDQATILGIHADDRGDEIDSVRADLGPDIEHWDDGGSHALGSALVETLRAELPDWGVYVVRVEPTEYQHRSGSAARTRWDIDAKCRRPLPSEVVDMVDGRPFDCPRWARHDTAWLTDTRQPTTIDDV